MRLFISHFIPLVTALDVEWRKLSKRSIFFFKYQNLLTIHFTLHENYILNWLFRIGYKIRYDDLLSMKIFFHPWTSTFKNRVFRDITNHGDFKYGTIERNNKVNVIILSDTINKTYRTENTVWHSKIWTFITDTIIIPLNLELNLDGGLAIFRWNSIVKMCHNNLLHWSSLLQDAILTPVSYHPW